MYKIRDQLCNLLALWHSHQVEWKTKFAVHRSTVRKYGSYKKHSLEKSAKTQKSPICKWKLNTSPGTRIISARAHPQPRDTPSPHPHRPCSRIPDSERSAEVSQSPITSLPSVHRACQAERGLSVRGKRERPRRWSRHSRSEKGQGNSLSPRRSRIPLPLLAPSTAVPEVLEG